MAPLLVLAFRTLRAPPAFGMLLLALYGIGHAAVIAFAGASADLVQRFLAWSGTSRAQALVRRTSCAAVVAGGVYFLYTAR